MKKYSEEKALSFLYYVSILNHDEFLKEEKLLHDFFLRLPTLYHKEVYNYITGKKSDLSKHAQQIYKNVVKRW